MTFPFTAIAVAAQFVVATGDSVPEINYESSCRAAAAANVSLGITIDDQSVSSCMAEERDARDKLAQQWTQFSPNDRMHCEQEAASGQMPSYVDLQTCLQIARDTGTQPKLESFVKKRVSTRGH